MDEWTGPVALSVGGPLSPHPLKINERGIRSTSQHKSAKRWRGAQTESTATALVADVNGGLKDSPDELPSISPLGNSDCRRNRLCCIPFPLSRRC